MDRPSEPVRERLTNRLLYEDRRPEWVKRMDRLRAVRGRVAAKEIENPM